MNNSMRNNDIKTRIDKKWINNKLVQEEKIDMTGESELLRTMQKN